MSLTAKIGLVWILVAIGIGVSVIVVRRMYREDGE